MKYFIAVHIGAGYHSKKLEKTYKSLIDRVLLTTVEQVNSNANQYKDAQSICELVISQLEDDPLTNAGRGSSLNQDGQVECDASIMDGRYYCRCSSGSTSCFVQHSSLTVCQADDAKRCGGGLWAGVGAVNGVCNPIKLASALVRKQQKSLTKSLGRIRPMMLVAEGAKEWASNHNIEIYDRNSLLGDPLITQQSNITYMNHNSRLEMHRNTKDQQQENNEDYYYDDEYQDDKTVYYDTVGAIVVDENGHIASGVSSGGISLKHRGRVGEAALFGSGCWAQDELFLESNGKSIPGVACSSTGVGEHIMRSMTSKQCCLAMQNNYADLAIKSYFENQLLNHSDCFGNHFERTTNIDKQDKEIEEKLEEEEEEEEYSTQSYNGSGDERLAGVIAIRKQTDRNTGKMDIELVWAHSTYSMGIGYISSKDNFKAHSLLSRINDDSPVGQLLGQL
ncbi:putative asparaginase 2 [Heterostelium album PN500]|uniref:Putative asparaginase 2 n=1 Tax=Heterostelium pallidum (strain ATCC 26659 / Pp 5 / PN500) TaxID=670386 RepID=D3BEM3_HETP5|nr:putative asparaginase 2 [Heterostelium album PN500]EFA80354.1 putative asparaginase 2 [Heterostelium album PN500]|eukprot:XP_020432474.1 putative asparaginase 2 [Heterostelium album PN500]